MNKLPKMLACAESKDEFRMLVNMMSSFSNDTNFDPDSQDAIEVADQVLSAYRELPEQRKAR